MCLFSWFKIISSQRDMSQQMLCAFDANSTGITARWHRVRSYLTDSKVTLNYISRDLMLTTPRKSDGSKSLAWISENKAVNGINFENISAIGCLVQMHRNLWPDKYLFLWHLMFYIYKRSNLVEFQSKLAFISHSRLELSTGSKKVELLVRQIQGQVFLFNLSIDTNARVK